MKEVRFSKLFQINNSWAFGYQSNRLKLFFI